MSITPRVCRILLVAVACGTWCPAVVAQVAFDRLEGFDRAMALELRDAGYDLDEASLITALLRHPRTDSADASIPVWAAAFLGRLPRNERIVDALRTASSDPLYAIALAAMRSLHRLGDTQWHDLARQRLAAAGNHVEELRVAILLAEARHADGWPVLVKALTEDALSSRTGALRDVALFDGLVYLDGRPIDVVAELEALRSQIPEAAGQFTDAIERIRQQRKPPQPTSGPLARAAPFLQQLVDAGYQPQDRFSLIQAMTGASELRMRLTAASALAGFPGDPTVVGALQAAAQGGDDQVAVRAIESLQTLGATGWQDTAAARLAVMAQAGGHGDGRITLARILAQAGRADGWPVITSALADNDWAVAALVEVPHFDGLTDSDGRIIDAAAVLQAMRALVPAGGEEGLNRLIGGALQQVEAKRAGRTR